MSANETKQPQCWAVYTGKREQHQGSLSKNGSSWSKLEKSCKNIVAVVQIFYELWYENKSSQLKE